jgi:hypothetical protein
MNTIQVNYDLKQPGRNYAAVEEYIKAQGAWAHPLESLWLIRTAKGVVQVRDELKQHVHPQDRVLVFNVTGDAWASSWSNEVTEWMKEEMRVAA